MYFLFFSQREVQHVDKISFKSITSTVEIIVLLVNFTWNYQVVKRTFFFGRTGSKRANSFENSVVELENYQENSIDSSVNVSK